MEVIGEDEFEDAVDGAWACIRSEAMQKLVVDLVNIPSRTGREGKAAEYLVSYMTSRGLDSELMKISEDRANAIGTLHGEGFGPRVLFNGHLDTSFTGEDEEDLPATGPLTDGFRPKAVVKGEWVHGLGAINMKGGVAAYTEAACALKESEVILKGEVVAAAVAGEIEKTQVKSLTKNYSGELYEGAGFGMEYYLKHSKWPDYSITCEPTGMAVTRAKCGYVLIKLTTHGDLTYRPYSDEDRIRNAIVSMSKVVGAIEREFSPEYTRRHTIDLGPDFGILKPRVNIGSIESGWPYKPGFVPAICCSYLDVRLVPGQTPQEAYLELETFLDDVEEIEELKVEQEIYGVKAPSLETPSNSKVVIACTNAFEYVSNAKHKPASPGRNSFGDDSLVTRKYGIPSVTWGPGGQLPEYAGAAAAAGGEGEFIRISDLLVACKMYIVAALNICNRESIPATQK
jgi:acetylornithine deacetylase/succinyl-diaminopimelate desuccinylase-like protein